MCIVPCRQATSTGLEPTLLLEQRRMHSSIADFPNQTFYSGFFASELKRIRFTFGFPGGLLFNWRNRL